MKTLTWDQVHARRLARNFLARPAPRTRIADAVGAVCGLQAQIQSAAELSLGIRVAGIARTDVRNELWERRTVVRTYGQGKARVRWPGCSHAPTCGMPNFSAM